MGRGASAAMGTAAPPLPPGSWSRGAESCRAGAAPGSGPRRLRLPSASPPPAGSSGASLTGVKLIINRVKLIKGLCARWGAGRALPLLSGSGKPPALGAPGAPGPSRKEKGGGERGGGGRRRRRRLQQQQQQQQQPRWWLTASESGGGSSRRGLAPGWLGSAQLGVRVRVQSRSPGAARGRCSAPQRQPPPPFPALPPPPPAEISLCHGRSGEPQGTRPGRRTLQLQPRRGGKGLNVGGGRGMGSEGRGMPSAGKPQRTWARLGSRNEPPSPPPPSLSPSLPPPSQPRGARPARIAALSPQQRSAAPPVLSAAPSNPGDPDNAAASPPLPPRSAPRPRAASSPLPPRGLRVRPGAALRPRPLPAPAVGHPRRAPFPRLGAVPPSPRAGPGSSYACAEPARRQNTN